MESRKIELVVVANLLLVPSQDIYLPLGSVVLYSAEIVKQGATERMSFFHFCTFENFLELEEVLFFPENALMVQDNVLQFFQKAYFQLYVYHQNSTTWL